ncbi:hypothetical protein PanWU01x14_138930 [Parasponia andersonii]|uniref:Uncharacterized protein n=1 Tax=Parasponia andersonii TaxID=3476 RepID=A0A2P5CMU2_PARAD|nr:hypothetical protein PanWU01x14_138930 [Parasponia andersonii]
MKKKKKILPTIVNQDLEFLRYEALKVKFESVYHSIWIPSKTCSDVY